MENVKEIEVEQSKKYLTKIAAYIMMIFGVILILDVEPNMQETLNMYKIIACFATAIFYFWHAKAVKGLGLKKGRLSSALMVWSVFLVSCFTLNTNIPVFGNSALWLKCAIVFSLFSHVVYSYMEDIGSVFLKNIILASLCFSLVIWLYFAIMLVPIYPFGLVGIILLGIGFHAFVPLLTVIVLIKILFWKEFKNGWKVREFAFKKLHN